MKLWVLAPIALLAPWFAREWLRAIGGRRWCPTAVQVAIGGVTDFFDTLGIGSFATTAALFKIAKQVRDDRIARTMMVGHTVLAIVQASIFLSLQQFDLTTLLLMASMAGAWMRAGVVAGLPRRQMQLRLGVAMAASALLLAIAQLRGDPASEAAFGPARAPKTRTRPRSYTSKLSPRP